MGRGPTYKLEITHLPDLVKGLDEQCRMFDLSRSTLTAAVLLGAIQTGRIRELLDAGLPKLTNPRALPSTYGSRRGFWTKGAEVRLRTHDWYHKGWTLHSPEYARWVLVHPDGVTEDLPTMTQASRLREAARRVMVYEESA